MKYTVHDWTDRYTVYIVLRQLSCVGSSLMTTHTEEQNEPLCSNRQEFELGRNEIERSKQLLLVVTARCRDKFFPAVKFFPPPVTLPSVLSAVCIAQN